jgi:putative ABC transport system permease protein
VQSFQVSPAYFDTLGIPITRGRAFADTDRADAERVAIVSETAVKRYWAGHDPVGARVRVSAQTPWLTVVGVAGDVLNRGLDDAAQPMLYRPLEQSSNLTLAFLVRTGGHTANLGDAVTRAVRSVDADLPVYGVRMMDDLLGRAVASRQFLMRILTAFGAAAIALALLGIYGVISYAVVQRTREIGIRIAIGAQRVQVLALILRQGLGAVGAGMAIGLAGALALARAMTSVLFGVSPFDPLTLGAVLGVMAAVAALAILLPARRAARVDPISALRLDV